MSGDEFVGFVTLGFSLATVLYFFGQIVRVFTEVIDDYINRGK